MTKTKPTRLKVMVGVEDPETGEWVRVKEVK